MCSSTLLKSSHVEKASFYCPTCRLLLLRRPWMPCWSQQLSSPSRLNDDFCQKKAHDEKKSELIHVRISFSRTFTMVFLSHNAQIENPSVPTTLFASCGAIAYVEDEFQWWKGLTENVCPFGRNCQKQFCRHANNGPSLLNQLQIRGKKITSLTIYSVPVQIRKKDKWALFFDKTSPTIYAQNILNAV